MKTLLVILALATAFPACKSAPRASSESPSPEETTFQVPSDPGLETLVILGTNDMHGALSPLEAKSRETGSTAAIPYERGGAAYLASHVRALRAQYGDRLLLLDAGDCFQGTLESNFEEGAPMVRLLNSLDYGAAAVGNHEFDYGPVGPEGSAGDPLGALKARMSEARYPYVAANIIEKSTKKIPPFPNTKPSVLLQVGRVKVGVIGLTTLNTPTTTRPDHIRELSFTSLKEATLRESKKLREQGAEVILVTAHVGLSCMPGHARAGQRLWKQSDPLGPCDEDGELVRYLNSIPPGTVDAVVSGHSHTIVHHWVNGVPVVQAGTRNQYFNLIYLTFDLKEHKLVPARTQIEGPVPVCPKVFAKQGNCDGDAPPPNGGRGALIPAIFHGQKMGPDPATETLLQPTFAAVAEAKKRVLGQAARPVEHPRGWTESEMGNLVSDAMRLQTGADFALANAGGLRAPFESGPITYEELYRTLPFDNFISILKVTGKELKLILRVAENGSKGYFPVSGLKLSLLQLGAPARSDDLDHDGKIEVWETNRLIGATFEDGRPIEDKKTYRLATLDFLVLGGDGLGWPMSQIPQERIEMAGGGMLRDAVEVHIHKLGVVNATDAPLIDPAHPRILFVKEAPRTGKTGKKSGKRSRRKRVR